MMKLKITALALTGVLPFLLAGEPAAAQTAAAVTKQQKAETCKLGADADSTLTGAKRTAFINKCMAAGNYEPKARQDHLKQAKNKKPAAAPAAAPAPAAQEDKED